MIPHGEILALRAEWGLRDDVIEKDYVLGWLLAAIASDRRAAQGSKVAGARVHDARVAALCIHHGVRELWSADRDFSRFAPLVVRNPLIQ